MADLLELAARCEAATGPDNALERDIRKALGIYHTVSASKSHFTASLDAAMSLVPEGAKVTTQNFGGPGPMVLVEPNERFRSAKTLALALCAAALRARASGEHSRG